MRSDGFSLIEVIVALTILSFAVLGVATSTSRMAELSAGAVDQASALQSVDDRLSLIQLNPSYAALDSLYERTEQNIPSAGAVRSTVVTRTKVTHADGKVTDYTKVTVTVSGPHVIPSVSRSMTVGAP